MSEQVISENRGAGVAEGFVFEEPPECKVVIYNDDFTTKDFVVEILMQEEIYHSFLYGYYYLKEMSPVGENAKTLLFYDKNILS